MGENKSAIAIIATISPTFGKMIAMAIRKRVSYGYYFFRIKGKIFAIVSANT